MIGISIVLRIYMYMILLFIFFGLFLFLGIFIKYLFNDRLCLIEFCKLYK